VFHSGTGSGPGTHSQVKKAHVVAAVRPRRSCGGPTLDGLLSCGTSLLLVSHGLMLMLMYPEEEANVFDKVGDEHIPSRLGMRFTRDA
jgi:hypothetical protein